MYKRQIYDNLDADEFVDEEFLQDGHDADESKTLVCVCDQMEDSDKVCSRFASFLDMIYSDEDKVSMDGQTYFEPHFKPDLNVDLLCSVNYFCHLVVVKRQLLEQAGNLNGEYNGAQDYDFVLRCVEKTDAVYHIPKILYHWRAHMDSTAENPESKRYAFEAGRRAIQKLSLIHI